MDCELEVIKNIFKKSINEFYDKIEKCCFTCGSVK